MEYTKVYSVIHGNCIIATYFNENEATDRMHKENEKLIKSDPELRYGSCTVQVMKMRTDELGDAYVI